MRPGLRLCSEATGKAERAAAGAPRPAGAISGRVPWMLRAVLAIARVALARQGLDLQ